MSQLSFNVTYDIEKCILNKKRNTFGFNILLGRHSLMADLMIWIFEGQLFSTLGCFPEKGFCDFQKSFKKMQIFSFASFS